MNDKNLKRRRKEYFLEGRRLFERWILSGMDERLRPDYPPLPEELRGMRCGAKTRSGTPCKRRDICDNGRCRLHGGMSTGPKTAEGKRMSSFNGMTVKKKSEPHE